MMKEFSNIIWGVAVIVIAVMVGSFFLKEVNVEFENSPNRTKIKIDTSSKDKLSTEEKEPIPKENIGKTLSLEESVKQFIDNFNNKNYIESFKFIKPYIVSQKGFADKEGYISYWEKNMAEFILEDVKKDDMSFHVMIKFKNINYDILKKYKLENKNNKWFITEELFSTKIENSQIKYEGKDSVALAYTATFNKDGARLRSWSRILYIGKRCDTHLIDNNEKKEYNGVWYQNDKGFIVEFEDRENIIFKDQEIRINFHQCYSSNI